MNHFTILIFGMLLISTKGFGLEIDIERVVADAKTDAATYLGADYDGNVEPTAEIREIYSAIASQSCSFDHSGIGVKFPLDIESPFASAKSFLVWYSTNGAKSHYFEFDGPGRVKDFFSLKSTDTLLFCAQIDGDGSRVRSSIDRISKSLNVDYEYNDSLMCGNFFRISDFNSLKALRSQLSLVPEIETIELDSFAYKIPFREFSKIDILKIQSKTVYLENIFVNRSDIGSRICSDLKFPEI